MDLHKQRNYLIFFFFEISVVADSFSDECMSSKSYSEPKCSRFTYKNVVFWLAFLKQSLVIMFDGLRLTKLWFHVSLLSVLSLL